MIQDALRLEFGRYTEWILEAAEAVEITDPVAIACRGTGDVALFEDLADSIKAAPRMRVLDAGCGMGGPAAWLRRNRGCDVVGVDLMEQSVRAARRLFDHSLSAVASASALPFAEGSFEAVWSVGVLEMLEDKDGAIAELARVLMRGGRVAVYSFVTAAEEIDDPPASDYFIWPEELVSLAEDAGLEVSATRAAAKDRGLHTGWRPVQAAVAAEIRRRHGGEPDYEAIIRELDRFKRLRAAGAVRQWRLDLTKP